MSSQLGLWQTPLPNCYFKPLLEPGDTHCLDIDPEQRNEVFSCENPKTYEILSHIRGASFDILAKPTPRLELPVYIPGIPNGSSSLTRQISLPFVSATLGDLISKKDLILAKDVKKRIGVLPSTKVIVLSYGEDELIEKIWPRRHALFKELSALDVGLVTAINYSVWLSDPHAERVINPKRSLLTFEEMQTFRLPTIPMIYWSGRKDLKRWLEWLNQNKSVKMLALNLQTEKEESFWKKTISDLDLFISQLTQPYHFLITGPRTPKRIREIKKIFPSFTLTNSYAAMMAWCSQLLQEDNKGGIKPVYSSLPKNQIFQHNIEFYENLLRSLTPPNFVRFQPPEFLPA